MSLRHGRFFVSLMQRFWIGDYFFSVWARKSMRYCFQTAAAVWVPWPRVASEMGMRMNLAWGICVTNFSGMPSSGGLMKSSAELIQRTGAVMVESLGAGL